jgi:NTE family protein
MHRIYLSVLRCFGMLQAAFLPARAVEIAAFWQDGGMQRSAFLPCLVTASALLLSACASSPTAVPQATAPVLQAAPPAPVRIGLALGGGAAKGFAHIGVIKILEANGFTPDMVSGTSAGSVVGALYASGMDAFALQQKAVALDEASIRDFQWSAGGLIKGQKLQDYVNAQVDNRPLERLGKPFVAVATRLEDGKRTVFAHGNTGQAVRASSSIPGVFEPVKIGRQHYVDGGVVSPVPVDAVRELGADIVIAVDISDKPRGQSPGNLMGTMSQSLAIMGQRLGQAELQHADIVIRPKVLDVGASDFTQRAQVMVEGEKAAMAVMPQLRERVARLRAQRAQAAQQAHEQALAQVEQARQQACLQQRSSLQKVASLAGLDSGCTRP